MIRQRVAAWVAGVLTLVLGLVGLGAGASLARENEPPVPPVRGAMLLFDTSASMTKAGLIAARKAATGYAESVPSDVRVGLITFGTKPQALVEPTTDRAELTDGLADLTLESDGTYLYDAILAGVSVLRDLGGAAERRIVVLSDGEDTTSQAALEAARKALVQEGIVADFVAYRYGEADTSAIKHLADGSAGRVIKAENAAQLATAFAEIAREPSTPAEANNPEPAWLVWLPDWSWHVLLIAALSFLALLVLILGVAFALRPREDNGKRLLDELSRYGPRREPSSQGSEQQLSSFAQRAVGLTEEVLRARGWEEKLAEKLDLADVKIKPAEWTVLRVCLSIAASAVLIVLGMAFFIAIPLGGALVWAGSYLVVRIRTSRRRSAFADQLPDVLQLIAGSLRSGFSLSQALDAVVRDDTQPSAGEFARALAETRIGVELEDALDRVAFRMASDDLRWVVMAIRIQREVGGNLAEVLLTTVTTMRERAQVRRQIRALSAEGRLSAYILLALPFIVGGLLAWMNPRYIEPLFTTGIGILMLIGAGILMLLGTFWMTRLVKVEV